MEDEPSHDSFAAFGRLMWYAVLVEFGVSALCWQVKPGMWDSQGHDPSTSFKIKEALKVLDELDTPAAADAALWLRQCKTELEHKRNALLHSVPITMHAWEGPNPKGLAIMPREGRSYYEIPITPEALEPLTEAFVLLADQWDSIKQALVDDRAN